jgi:hypothetical protein
MPNQPLELEAAQRLIVAPPPLVQRLGSAGTAISANTGNVYADSLSESAA